MHLRPSVACRRRGHIELRCCVSLAKLSSFCEYVPVQDVRQTEEAMARKLFGICWLVLIMAISTGAATLPLQPSVAESRQQSASPDAGPSLADTLSWLKDRLAADGGTGESTKKDP